MLLCALSAIQTPVGPAYYSKSWINYQNSFLYH